MVLLFVAMFEIENLKDDIGPLRDPVLIVGFAVRRRAGRLASQAVGHMVEQWGAEKIARIDPESLIDFTVRRPTIDRNEIGIELEWPETTIYVARPEGSQHDFLLLMGFEPNFTWRTFVETLTSYADALGIKTLVTLRAFPGNVPHTRPAPVTINASDVDLELQFGVQSRPTRYQGPTDLAGVLAAQGQTLRWQTADLTVMQPYYFPRMPNAAAMMALVKVIDHAFNIQTPIASLEETAEAQTKAIEAGIAADSETQSVILELERRYDAGALRMDFLTDDSDPPASATELPSGAELVDEIERLLRGGLETDER